MPSISRTEAPAALTMFSCHMAATWSTIKYASKVREHLHLMQLCILSTLSQELFGVLAQAMHALVPASGSQTLPLGFFMRTLAAARGTLLPAPSPSPGRQAHAPVPGPHPSPQPPMFHSPPEGQRDARSSQVHLLTAAESAVHRFKSCTYVPQWFKHVLISEPETIKYTS